MVDVCAKTVVYGTGGAASQLLANHGQSLGEVCFAATQGGGEFMGQPVMGLEELAASGLSRIIIASTYLNAILTALQQHGIPLTQVAWYFHEEDRILEADEIGINLLDHEQVLYAFYDLAMNPSTYDSAVFAARAEMERQRLGKQGIHFVIVPSLIAGGRPGDLWRYGGMSEVHWRQDYIVAGVFRLLPSCVGCSRLAYRQEARALQARASACFPTDYDLDHPQDEHKMTLLYPAWQAGGDPLCLQAPPKALEQVRQWLIPQVGGRKLLTLTMREYDYQQGRNTQVEAWASFFASLDQQQYAVVIVRDTDKALAPLPSALQGYISFPQASFDVNFRMALYELAYLNLTINTGPSALMYFSKVPYLMFKWYLPEYSVTSAEFHRSRFGMEVGENFPPAKPWQKFIWEPDQQDVIAAEFAAWEQAHEQKQEVVL
ncbi:hypothetical protein [Balneatrix alpica]|uniref:Uncharacterized protein n=1 Tax=Balneatrix alpica TaxID=75684 RepID=A0ABV5ZFL9_9GAMM|nr:hypothetical protein [Balneatrix alpica]